LKCIDEFNKGDLDWLEKVTFKCEDFGFSELFGTPDIDILKESPFAFLRPGNSMHPDGILVLNHEGKFYFVIVTCKIGSKELSKETILSNIYGGDLDLIYVDKYVTLKNYHEGRPQKKIRKNFTNNENYHQKKKNNKERRVF